MGLELTNKPKIKIEHQSNGYFEYGCLKGDACYFCDVMNRKPLTDDQSFRKNGWTPNEIKYLIENYSIQTVAITCKYLNKTRGAVFTKVCELRKSIPIKPPKKSRPQVYAKQIKSKQNRKFIRAYREF